MARATKYGETLAATLAASWPSAASNQAWSGFACGALDELVGCGHELQAAFERAAVVPAALIEALGADAATALGGAAGDVAGDGVDVALVDLAAADEVYCQGRTSSSVSAARRRHSSALPQARARSFPWRLKKWRSYSSV